MDKIQDKKFILSAESTNGVFKFNNKNKCVSFDTENYQKLVCDEFGKNFNKTCNVKNAYARKQVIIRLYCAAKSCKKTYILRTLKADIHQHEPVEFNVTEGSSDCDHKNEKLVRNLSKAERQKVAEKLRGNSVAKIRNEEILKADKSLLANGNLQTVRSPYVLRKVRAEYNSNGDIHADPMIDLILRSQTMSHIHDISYKNENFGITIFNESHVKMLLTYIKTQNEKNEINRWFYDATGGICKSLNKEMKPLLHHIIIIPMKANKNDNINVLVPIAEFITCLHTSDNQEIFLRRFIQYAKRISKKEVLAEEIVSDFCYAAINALTAAFNNMTFKKYLDSIFSIIYENNNEELQNLTVIKLCSSHLTKNIKQDIKVHYKKLKSDKFVHLCAIIGNIFNISSMKELDDYVKKVIDFLMNENEGDQVAAATKMFKKYGQESTESVLDETQTFEHQQDAFEEFSVIYRNSKFFQLYDNHIKSRSFDDVGPKNQFCNPQFVACFLKKYIAFLGLWTQVITHKRSITAARANNGYVEGFFGQLKNDLKKDGFSLGKIKLPRYLEYVGTSFDAKTAAIEFQIPMQSTRKSSKKKPKEVEFEDLNQQVENWRNRGNSGDNTLFFNSKNL